MAGPDETRTTLRPESTRIRPLTAADAKARVPVDPDAAATTIKRDPAVQPDPPAPASADDLLGTRTTIKREGDPDAPHVPTPSEFQGKTTLKREGEIPGMQHSEARSTRILLGQTARPKLELDIGSVIKQRFEIVEELGRGGMGVVYRAKDLRKVEAKDPDPYLAIKVLIGDMAEFDMGFVALQREGKHAQALNHPNLVKVFDFDRDGHLVFLTMELLKGESLQSRMRDDRAHPMSSEERLRIARGLISGLAYAHARKIVHADIKPSNVFLCEGGEPKILDFGIARAAERDAVFDADDIGALTVDYASVEMLAGERPQPADDVYAMGCLLFRLYAGQHPYQHRPADLAKQEKLRADFPRNLTRMQARALAKAIAFDRADRFVDAAALGRAFDAYDWLRFSRNAALVLVALGIAGWLSHEWVQSRWSAWQLDPGQRAKVEQALVDAHGNLDKQYWEDAAARFVEALRIDPYNPDARAGLMQVIGGMSGSMPGEDLDDAMLILRERTQCTQGSTSCPEWAQRILAAPPKR